MLVFFFGWFFGLLVLARWWILWMDKVIVVVPKETSLVLLPWYIFRRQKCQLHHHTL